MLLCVLFDFGYEKDMPKKKEVLAHPRVLIHLQIIAYLQILFRMMGITRSIHQLSLTLVHTGSIIPSKTTASPSCWSAFR